MTGVRNGLYTVETEMTDGGRGRATGVIALVDGKIAGGDAHFYYTGSYTADNGKWRGELTTFQHAKPVGVLPLFGGREVTCGFTGTYADDSAIANGTALVGKTSVMFQTRLKFRAGLQGGQRRSCAVPTIHGAVCKVGTLRFAHLANRVAFQFICQTTMRMHVRIPAAGFRPGCASPLSF